MIYDCFMFHDEIDLLEIRFNILDDVVDKFVIVEGARTTTGKIKKLNYPRFRDKFEVWKEKIIYVFIDDYPPFESTWQYELWQRNGIGQGLKGCSENDIIIISDVDEIPNPHILKNRNFENFDSEMVFAQMFANYYLNYIDISDNAWYGSVIVPFKDYISAHEHRNLAIKFRKKPDEKYVITNGGWHFSFLGGIEAIKHKLKTYTHQEYNIQKFENEEVLLKAIKKGKSIFHKKDYRFKPVTIDNRFPEYIRNNIDKYNEYILKNF